MRWRISEDDVQLSEYQRQLIERLTPILERIDDERVADSAGLSAAGMDERWVVHLTVEARAMEVPGLHLIASPDQCILSLANSEILECHQDPASAPALIDRVVALAEKYLSGTTVIEARNAQGQKVRADYFFGFDSECDAANRIGSESFPLVLPGTIASTVKRTFRFLREALAAEQGVPPGARGLR